MGVLHLVNSSEGLTRCCNRLGPEDALILLEGGVYAAMTTAAIPNGFDVELFVLLEHLSQRGIATCRVLPVFVVIDFEGFVRLTAKHSTSVTWA